MRDSNVANAAKESTQGEFSHGLPDKRIAVEHQRGSGTLDRIAGSFVGFQNGDGPRWIQLFWERAGPNKGWHLFQMPTNETEYFAGRQAILKWDNGSGPLSQSEQAFVKGREAWGKDGVIVRHMRDLPCSLYNGDLYDQSSAAIIPKDAADLAAIWAFCSSPDFAVAVRRIDQALKVTNATLVKVSFDLAHWQSVAAEKFPSGLPEPYSDDPTQWLFHGHPRYAEAGGELHVALARLAGYRWPAEIDPKMRLSAEARARIAEAATLPEADSDGLLPLVPVLGQRQLADRLRTYCAGVWGNAWTPGTEARLITSACERAKDKPPKQLTLDGWLRTHAARQHAKLFHDRPFLWWITDGRADGFTAVAHYHGLSRANLERLAYTVLGNWMTRLGDDPRAEAARVLQAKLARILEGESPYDIFVRWKPLERQPFGWDPDLDDGVRLNVRPFIEAVVLAFEPNVKYGVDRGKDIASAPWYAKFNGERRNDHHTTLAEKRAARGARAAAAK
jgi:hypothetical protein